MNPLLTVAGLVAGGIGGVSVSEFLKARGAPPLLVDVALMGAGLAAFIESRRWTFAKAFAAGFAGETAVRGLRVLLGEPSVFRRERDRVVPV